MAAWNGSAGAARADATVRWLSPAGDGLRTLARSGSANGYSLTVARNISAIVAWPASFGWVHVMSNQRGVFGPR